MLQMERTGTKPKEQTIKGCKKKSNKQVKSSLTEDDKCMKFRKYPLKENVGFNFPNRHVDAHLKSHKPNAITLQKNSLLGIERKIKNTEMQKFKPYKEPSQLPIDSLITFEEKITKKLNFPIEKKLYRQLISLNLTEKLPSQHVPVSYEPAVKDREPRLENYYNPSFVPEKPTPVFINFPPHTCTRTSDAYRNYQITKSWKKS